MIPALWPASSPHSVMSRYLLHGGTGQSPTPPHAPGISQPALLVLGQHAPMILTGDRPRATAPQQYALIPSEWLVHPLPGSNTTSVRIPGEAPTQQPLCTGDMKNPGPHSWNHRVLGPERPGCLEVRRQAGTEGRAGGRSRRPGGQEERGNSARLLPACSLLCVTPESPPHAVTRPDSSSAVIAEAHWQTSILLAPDLLWGRGHLS